MEWNDCVQQLFTVYNVSNESLDGLNWIPQTTRRKVDILSFIKVQLPAVKMPRNSKSLVGLDRNHLFYPCLIRTPNGLWLHTCKRILQIRHSILSNFTGGFKDTIETNVESSWNDRKKNWIRSWFVFNVIQLKRKHPRLSISIPLK